MSVNTYMTTCPLDCFDCCSLQVSANDAGEIISITGNKEHPITNGFICEKGKKHLERVRHPLRLKYPMVKSDGEWHRISWNESLDIIAGRVNRYISEFGSESIGLYSYSGSSGLLKSIENLFFDYLGSTTKIYGSICLGAGREAQKLDFGKVLGHAEEDIVNSRTIIIWGRNPAETNIHLVPHLKAAKERGTSIILVDPLSTATSMLCDRHIRIKPEGDAALACAVTKHVLEKGEYDREFAERYTVGFEEMRGFLSGISMNALTELSGASIEDIRLLGDSMVNGKPAAIYIGYGMQRYPYGGAAVRCIDMLAALTGNIGIPGGGANYANLSVSEYIDYNPFKIKPKKPRMVLRSQFGKAVKKLSDPPLKLLFVSRANPVLQLPNSGEVVEALDKIEYKVCIEHFFTDTAEMCDMLLPATYFLEEEDVVSPGMWSHYLGSINKCAGRYFEARPEYEIYTELAERLGIEEFPKLSGRQWLELMLKPLINMGLRLEELKESGYVRNPAAKSVPWEDKSFATVSGKFEIIPVQELEKCFRSIAEQKKEKFRLLTVHTRKSLHSQHMLDAAEERPAVYISSRDAIGEGISEGDTVKLWNENGFVVAKAVFSDAAECGILYMNEGWWHKSGGSVNRLTPDGESDIGGQGIMNHCFCDIERVKVD